MAMNSCFTTARNFDLNNKRKKKKDLIEKLSSFGKCPDLFDKKVRQITVSFSFSTALKLTYRNSSNINRLERFGET